MDTQKLTVSASIQASISKVWECWTSPEHITQWNAASDEWHCPAAENDLQPGGKFSYRMEAKDGSMGFDYSGTYDEIIEATKIILKLDDGRSVNVSFQALDDDRTKIVEEFEPDAAHPSDFQK